ncbi:MAG: thiamine pyrophosphate-binding protein [Candidatus Pacearchaeota archaeon]
MFEKITKYCGSVYCKEDLLKELKKVYFQITTGRPGPVCLEIATDIMNEEVELNNFYSIFSNNKQKLAKKNFLLRKKIKRIVKLLTEAKIQ